MGSRSRTIPAPWPSPPVRTALELKAGLLDSQQEILGAEEVSGEDLASGLQLQWAAQAEFPNVPRPFELDCGAIPLPVAGGGGFFAVLAGAVVGHHR